MAAYQFLNPAPVLFTINGIEPVAGGTLSFFDEGTTNPRDTWNDPDLVSPGHLNANPVPLDAAGRSESAIWLDGDYTVVLRDSLGDEVWSRVVRSDVTSALAIPALSAGFLTNDLSNLLWQDILLIPDPTGSTNYILSNDGANLLWIPQAEPGPPVEPDIEVTDTSFQAGISSDATKFLIQSGSGTAPVSASRTTTDSITFPTAYSKIWHVDVTANISAVGSFGIGATVSVSGYTPGSVAAGATVTFNSADDGGGSGFTIVNPIPYTWVAFGVVEVAP